MSLDINSCWLHDCLQIRRATVFMGHLPLYTVMTIICEHISLSSPDRTKAITREPMISPAYLNGPQRDALLKELKVSKRGVHGQWTHQRDSRPWCGTGSSVILLMVVRVQSGTRCYPTHTINQRGMIADIETYRTALAFTKCVCDLSALALSTRTVQKVEVYLIIHCLLCFLFVPTLKYFVMKSFTLSVTSIFALSSLASAW